MPRKSRPVSSDVRANSFGEWSSQRRLALGLTQKRVAYLAKCSVPWVKKIEHGETPSERIALALARALNIPTHLHSRFIRAALSNNARDLPPVSSIESAPTPPAPTAPPPHQNKFFGRTAELAAIDAALRDPWCRLLTLRGPGGIGKTRLAIHASQQYREQFDGVCFVSLREIASTDLFPQALTAALGIPQVTGIEPTQQIAGYLREVFPKLLFVLDNFEHLLEAAPLLHDLLTSVPELKILATSREQLHLEWERILEIDGLEYPAAEDAGNLENFNAVQLFVERARRVYPRFPIRAELPDAARICRQVQGHPLAIEMAAAWVGVHSCGEIAAQIEASIDALKKQRADTTHSHASITATFEYSYRLLMPDEQILFRRLAFFEGGFDAHAAAQVTQTPSNFLTMLADKSLVQREGRRFDLHELLRRYALEKILVQREETDATARRMFQYFLDFAQTHHTMYAELEKEWSNLNAGLRLAHAQQNYPTMQAYVDTLQEPWEKRGRYLDARQAYRLACELAQASGDARAYARYLCEWGKGCLEQGDYEEAERLLLASRVYLAELEDWQQVGYVNVLLARLKKDLAQLDEADDLLALAEPLLLASTENIALAEFYYHKGGIRYYRSEFSYAKELLEKGIQVAARLGEDNLQAKILALYGHVLFHGFNELALAEQVCQRAIALAEQVHNEAALIEALYYLSGICHRLGKLGEARASAGRALELTKRVGDSKTQTRLLFRQSQLDFADGQVASTIKHASESFARCTNDDIGRMHVAAHLGNLYATANQICQAASFWRQALAIAHKFDPLLASNLQQKLDKIGSDCDNL